MKTSFKKLQTEVKLLRSLAYRDELTGLYNRRGFKEEAKKFLDEIIPSLGAEKRKKVIIGDFSLVIFDIDYFKRINDTFGHPAGDLVLRAFAKAVLGQVREIDIVARWGGEEVLVGLIGASEKDAAEIAEGIRAGVGKINVRHKKKNISFTVSAGVASFDHARSFEALLECADQALYAAKHAGRDRVVKCSDLR